MNWKPGDRAIVNLPRSDNHGAECTVIATGLTCGTTTLRRHHDGVKVDLMPSREVLEVRPHQTHAVFLPHHLIPVDDEYDGLGVTTWDQCPWKPVELVGD